MAESLIYINPEINTGHIKEASFDLLHDSQRVAEKVIDSIDVIPPDDNEIIDMYNVSKVVSLHTLDPRLRRKWANSEIWVSRLLHMSKLINFETKGFSSPDYKPNSVAIPAKSVRSEVQEYWEDRFKAVASLITIMSNPPFDTRSTATSTFYQSRLMRRALAKHIY